MKDSSDDDDLCFSDLEEYSDDSDLEMMERILPDDERDSNRLSSASTSASKPKVTGLKHLNQMKSLLALDSFREMKDKRKERKKRAKARKKEGKVGADGQKIIQTLASRLKSSSSAPELVVYNDPRKRAKKQKSEGKMTPLQDDDDEEMSMKQARFDVFKFGLGGFGKEEKADAEVAQLLRLGAKPGKNKCYEYSEFKVMRQKKREEEKREREESRRTGMMTAVSSSRRTTSTKAKKKGSSSSSSAATSKKGNKKKKKKGGESIQAKVGSFDGGMLKLSAKDLAKIKGSKK